MDKILNTPNYDLKILGLCIIQFFGSALAFAIHVLSPLPSLHFYHMDRLLYWEVLILLFILLVITFVVGLMRPTTRKLLRNIVQSVEESVPDGPIRSATKEEAATFLRLFAGMDVFTAGFCMMNTGGSETSVFSPFLFIVVPMIAIIKVSSWQEIFWFTIISFVIYLAALFSEFYLLIFPSAKDYQNTGHIRHEILLLVTTVVCTSFPACFTIMEHKYRNARVVSSSSKVEPPSAVAG